MDKNLTLDVRYSAAGEPFLYFPFMSISDVHLGTRHSRAKRLSHMLSHTGTDYLFLVGDIIDGELMRKKERWNFGDWHRQVVGHICRKAGEATEVTYIPGNHDEGIRRQKVQCDGKMQDHRNLCGTSIYGIQIEELAYFVDMRGCILKLIHGDQYDRTLGTTGNIGDLTLELIAHIDTAFQLLPKCHHISLAAKSKKATKKVVDKIWSIRKHIADDVDGNELLHGIVTGHSHMSEISRSPAGKFVLNDGCCTEHIEALVQDQHGKFAILEWHQNYLKITEETIRKGRIEIQQRSMSWQELGLDVFREPPRLLEDANVQRADRLIRLFYRMWPPKERKHLKHAAAFARAAEQAALGLPNPMKPSLHKNWSRRKYRRIRRMASFMRATGEIARSTGYLPLPNPSRDRRRAIASTVSDQSRLMHQKALVT